ncbi:hypothetical protein MIS46_02565 [Wielerella bovis]|uniref:hypothetical protein n=1 Tax=Wielerella bovis TaxID=2917790 RepID=UPI00201919F4|nr:hypothetical protein [Wielerella bovis]ULJ60833.1 hypothetical protein MIS44_02925 [Wielerella bovis]ULJ62965.1 hypothetical protein MIS46_02565 [Wielerella bovis]
MSEIKVSCPECKNSVLLNTEILNQTKGRASCPSCGFVFHLVKKAKKKPVASTEKPRPEAPEPTPRRESANTPRPNDALMFEEVDDNPPLIPDVDDSLKNMFDDFADLDDDGVNSTPPQPAEEKPRNPLYKTVSELSSLKTQQQPLSYRIPKAQNVAQMFADATAAQGQPFAFTLLDRDSVASQLPQVTVKEKADDDNQSSELRQDGQQNNITIHTDSLVFTLLGDGQNTTSVNNTQPDSATQTATQTQMQTVAVTNEMNWTIATLSALIVLIVQLFYWVMMMM